MQANRLFQERTQQPTLPRSIRAMKRGREGGREKVDRGRSERLPVMQGGRGWGAQSKKRLRDHTEMTKHEA